MLETKDCVQFDPGFLQHMSGFLPNIQYVYQTLDKFKNFSQKKTQFKMFYPKITGLLKNYFGFYAGCMLWAAYISTKANKPIVNNICNGGEYSENETLSEVKLIEIYIEQLQKDAKYYAGQDFSVNERDLKILSAYKEFLIVNKGFTETSTTNDIKLPESFKKPSDMDEILEAIDKAVNDGKLYALTELIDKVI